MFTFSVSQNCGQYKATHHPFRIGLSTFTKVEEVKDDLPLYSYSFVKLDDILKIKERKEAEYLIGNIFLPMCSAPCTCKSLAVGK